MTERGGADQDPTFMRNWADPCGLAPFFGGVILRTRPHKSGALHPECGWARGILASRLAKQLSVCPNVLSIYVAGNRIPNESFLPNPALPAQFTIIIIIITESSFLLSSHCNSTQPCLFTAIEDMTFDFNDIPDLSGRIALVTGGNTGIGEATVRHLAAHGARVYMGARSSDKAAAAIAKIKEAHPSADVRHLQMDHMSLASVKAAANTFTSQESQLHILVNNAGIMGTELQISKDGNEAQWQTNYLAHWLLTKLLLPLIISTAEKAPRGAVRIVNVSSSGHKLFAPKEGIRFKDTALDNESKMTRYGQSKLANVLHAKTLDALYGPGSEHAQHHGPILTASLHPGAVDTQLNTQVSVKGMGWVNPVLKCAGVFSDPDDGAMASLFCASAKEFSEDMSGKYFDSKAKVINPSDLARDQGLRDELEAWTTAKMKSEGWIE